MKHLLFALLTFFPGLLPAQNPDSITLASVVDSLIQASQKSMAAGKVEKAFQLIEQAKDKAESSSGTMSAIYAKCLHTQVDLLVKVRNFKDALPICIMAKDIREKVLGKEHFDYSLSLSYLATLYKELGQYGLAEPLALETKELRAKNPGKESKEYAITLHLLGSLYYVFREYKKSESYFLEAKSIFAKTPGEHSFQYSNTLNSLAALYTEWGKFDKLEDFHINAIKKLDKSSGKVSAAYAGTLNNLAWLYFQTGQYGKAEPLFLEANQIFLKLHGKKDEQFVSQLNNLALLYYQTGKYGKAELLYQEAIDIMAKIASDNKVSYAAALSNLGVLYADIGNYDKAEALYLKAKQNLENEYGKYRASYATCLTNLGDLYYKTFLNDKAEVFLEEAKNIRKTELGDDHPDYAASLINLGQLYLDKKEYDKAQPLLLESKDIFLKKLSGNHPLYAISLLKLAEMFTAKGDYGQAESLYMMAKDGLEKSLGKAHPNYAFALSSLTRFYRSANRLSELSPLYLELNALIQHIVDQSVSFFSEQQMLAYLQTFEPDIAQVHSFSQISDSPELHGACFNNALFYNGYLLENARRISRSFANADSLTRDTFYRWQVCRHRLAKEYAKPIAERRYVAETEAEAEGYEKTLTRNLPKFKEAMQVPKWRDVRDRLRAGEAAVEFIHYRYYTPDPTDSTMYAALVLLPNDTTPHFIPLFEERQLQALLDRPGLDEELVIKHLYGNSPDLRKLLWQPLEPFLRDAKTIYYSPAGLLHRINPAALQDESRQTLSEGRQWVRVGSTRELVTGRLADKSFAKMSAEAASNIGNPPSAIIYGGITYDMDSLAYCADNFVEQMDSTEDYQPKDGNFRYIVEGQTIPRYRSSNIYPDSTWRKLDDTGHEADEVGALLAGAGFQATVQKGLFASEERFKRIGVAAPSPRILHIATHGFSYPDPQKDSPKGFGNTEPTYKLLDDPMLRSGLLLAGANYYWKNKRPLTNREDGILVAYEVSGLNLQNTELAVLSACQTGLGDVVGSEGVYGLQRAFRIAGAKFLIVSLWEVPDEQTRELMHLFYQNWVEKQESLRDAFNHAQQRLREKEPIPYMWAGFVLVE